MNENESIRQPEHLPRTPTSTANNFLRNWGETLQNGFIGLGTIASTFGAAESLARGDIKTAIIYGLGTAVGYTINVMGTRMSESKLHNMQQTIQNQQQTIDALRKNNQSK